MDSGLFKKLQEYNRLFPGKIDQVTKEELGEFFRNEGKLQTNRKESVKNVGVSKKNIYVFL